MINHLSGFLQSEFSSSFSFFLLVSKNVKILITWRLTTFHYLLSDSAQPSWIAKNVCQLIKQQSCDHRESAKKGPQLKSREKLFLLLKVLSSELGSCMFSTVRQRRRRHFFNKKNSNVKWSGKFYPKCHLFIAII